MYIFKNALVSISRNKGRNILLGIILIVIGCATTVALAIRSSATDLIESYNSQFDIEATLAVNRENMMQNFRPGEGESDGEQEPPEDFGEIMEGLQDSFASASSITLEDITNYADSKYVKSYTYTQTINMNAEDIEKVSSSFGRGEENAGEGRQDFGGNQNMATNGDFTIVGYSSLSAMKEFIDGQYQIVDGEVSDEEGTCVINDELATLNELEVGDTITLVNPNNEEITHELVISGIFEEKSSDDGAAFDMFSASANQIVTLSSEVETIASLDEEISVTVSPTFILTGEDAIEPFTEELTEKGLSEYLTVNTNIDSINSATSSVANLKSFATTFLVIAIIISVVVLLVLNSINIRERKYEIGVLRTIGMKKSLLTGQFMLELLIVTLVSLGIGAGIGAAVSLPVSNNLLASEIESSQEENSSIEENFGRGENSGGPNGGFNREMGINTYTVQAYDSIDAVVNLKVIGQLFGLGILLTLISSLASMVSIQRFSPLQILKERS